MTMHAGEIAKLTDVDLKNLGARAAERERTVSKRLGKSIHYKSAATVAVATAEKFK
jgi:NAD(P)H-hydrate repair Nnr-like enzyme with NAD(P)H-hydrate dehydratase domain